jgi:NodT family efflux transporter outer membrane factor (OMF) lipoprotein
MNLLSNPIQGRRPLTGVSLVFLLFVVSSACMVGPNYKRPAAIVPPAFREPPPSGWKQAQPNDGSIRGKWWEIYGDPDLNALEERIVVNNQNVLALEAQFRAARDAVRVARAALYPTVSANASITNSRTSAIGGVSLTGGGGSSRTNYLIPGFDVSWTADVWGSIRRSVTASAETAQATAAQLENVKLTLQADLALDYFSLHGLDGDLDVFENTVKSFEEALTLTKNRFAGGVATGGDVAQAETQLATARAQLTDFNVARAQLEHAIAILTGRPPIEVTIPRRLLTAPPPPIPIAVPSALLERRPDVAQVERQMAAQNEQIGIAQAAFYPTIGLGGSFGLQRSSFTDLFTWPSRFWSLGPSASVLLYDAGRRRAIVREQENLFDAATATYRQTVLTAFQQVEDALSTLRILEVETGDIRAAVDAAQRSLDISIAQYKAGTVTYLQVITSQTALLQNQRTAVDVLTRRLTSSVDLIQAMGGGFDASQLPTVESIKKGL